MRKIFEINQSSEPDSYNHYRILEQFIEYGNKDISLNNLLKQQFKQEKGFAENQTMPDRYQVELANYIDEYKLQNNYLTTAQLKSEFTNFVDNLSKQQLCELRAKILRLEFAAESNINESVMCNLNSYDIFIYNCRNLMEKISIKINQINSLETEVESAM